MTGSFSRRPWKALDWRRLKPKGCSFSVATMEWGRGRFSPLTLRGEGERPADRRVGDGLKGVDLAGVGSCERKGDLETRLLLRMCLLLLSLLLLLYSMLHHRKRLAILLVLRLSTWHGP